MRPLQSLQTGPSRLFRIYRGIRFVIADRAEPAEQFSASRPATDRGNRVRSSSGRGRDDCGGRVGHAHDLRPDRARTGYGRPPFTPLPPPLRRVAEYRGRGVVDHYLGTTHLGTTHVSHDRRTDGGAGLGLALFLPI